MDHDALMSRIADAFARTRAENRAAFIGYLCACDPDFETSVRASLALIGAGVDLLELGVPFSDPLADGLTNQLAAQRALAAGANNERVLALVGRIRERSAVPIVFYTYYNLVFTHGVDPYLRAAAQAGVDGMLILDLPPEEAAEAAVASRAHGIDSVCIVAPTTPESRLPKIAAAATGFIYYVSREGVTGTRDRVADGIPEAVARIRRHSPLPIAVGFGISNRRQVAEVAASADGVVVGSALVNVIRDNLAAPEAIPGALAARAADLAAGTRR